MASSPAKAKRSRWSDHIRIRQASNLYHGIRVAQAIGTPLNRFVTINLSMAGITDEAASETFRKLCERYGDWVRRPPRNRGLKPITPAYVWVIEAAGGVVAAHWAIHVPLGRLKEFDGQADKWLGRFCENPIGEGVTLIKPITSPIGLGRYMLKGIYPNAAPMFGVRPVDQGIVFNKRSGVSLSLGPSVKKTLRAEGLYPKARRRISLHPSSQAA